MQASLLLRLCCRAAAPAAASLPFHVDAHCYCFFAASIAFLRSMNFLIASALRSATVMAAGPPLAGAGAGVGAAGDGAEELEAAACAGGA